MHVKNVSLQPFTNFLPVSVLCILCVRSRFSYVLSLDTGYHVRLAPVITGLTKVLKTEIKLCFDFVKAVFSLTAIHC